MAQVAAMIGGARRVRRWAARIFLQPASITLVSRPAGAVIASARDRAD